MKKHTMPLSEHNTFFKCILFSLAAALMLCGCAPSSPKQEKAPAAHVESLSVGHRLKIQNIDSRLLLVDNNSVLAADGLFYASWGMGKATPYKNSDGETADLYDASLYLLLGESKDPASAQNNMDTWLNAAKDNYEITEEQEITCGGQAYTILTYQCAGEDNPYARGMSALGTAGSDALCIELTCREGFEEDLSSLLTTFLEGCILDTDETIPQNI